MSYSRGLMFWLHLIEHIQGQVVQHYLVAIVFES